MSLSATNGFVAHQTLHTPRPGLPIEGNDNMVTRNSNSKRRRWKRFKNRGGAIVMLHKPRLIDIGKPRLVELGPVIDISLGGLAVQYIESKKRIIDADVLSVTIPGVGIKLEKIPFEVISDTIKAELPDSRKIRMRCVKFAKLSPYQTFQLESFIQNFTNSEGFDRRSGTDRRNFEDPQFDDESYRTLYDRRILRERRLIP